jgi:hypothetical protein
MKTLIAIRCLFFVVDAHRCIRPMTRMVCNYGEPEASVDRTRSSGPEELQQGIRRGFSRLRPLLLLGSEQLSLCWFQVCLPGNGPYLALEPHFPYRNGRHKATVALEEYTNRPPPKPPMLCSEALFNFYLLHKCRAADRDRLKPAIVSSRYVSARSCFDLFTIRLLKS